MNMNRIGTTMIWLRVASSVLGACSSTTTSATSTTDQPDSVPHGWKSHTYGRATISVPSDWEVEPNSSCPIQSAPGTLNLGSPRRYSGCPDGVSFANVVDVSSLPAGEHLTSSCIAIKVNGLRVYVGPCGSSDAPGNVFDTIPSLGVAAEGVGTLTRAEGGRSSVGFCTRCVGRRATGNVVGQG